VASTALAVCTERRAIIARCSKQKSRWSFNFLVPAARARRSRTGPPQKIRLGGAMTFYDPTRYGRDEEEEFGDSGAYSESLEEDFEEEEEAEEGVGLPEPKRTEPQPMAVPAPPPPRPAPAG